MLIDVEFPYYVCFRKSKRASIRKTHKVMTKHAFEVRSIDSAEFPLACVIEIFDKGKVEYHFFEDSFWKEYPKAEATIKNAYSASDYAPDEAGFQEASEKGTICIDGDDLALQVEKIQECADQYIYSDGLYWHKVPEPVAIKRGREGEMAIIPCSNVSTNSLGNVFNLRDAVFPSSEPYRESQVKSVSITLPEAFHYGYDETMISAAIAKQTMSFWPSYHDCGLMSAKLLSRVMPSVVDKVKKSNKLPYQFDFQDVYRALSESLDELAC